MNIDHSSPIYYEYTKGGFVRVQVSRDGTWAFINGAHSYSTKYKNGYHYFYYNAVDRFSHYKTYLIPAHVIAHAAWNDKDCALTANRLTYSIDHIDEDKSNNRFSNLQKIKQCTNIMKHKQHKKIKQLVNMISKHSPYDKDFLTYVLSSRVMVENIKCPVERFCWLIDALDSS